MTLTEREESAEYSDTRHVSSNQAVQCQSQPHPQPHSTPLSSLPSAGGECRRPPGGNARKTLSFSPKNSVHKEGTRDPGDLLRATIVPRANDDEEARGGGDDAPPSGRGNKNTMAPPQQSILRVGLSSKNGRRTSDEEVAGSGDGDTRPPGRENNNRVPQNNNRVPPRRSIISWGGLTSSINCRASEEESDRTHSRGGINNRSPPRRYILRGGLASSINHGSSSSDDEEAGGGRGRGYVPISEGWNHSVPPRRSTLRGGLASSLVAPRNFNDEDPLVARRGSLSSHKSSEASSSFGSSSGERVSGGVVPVGGRRPTFMGISSLFAAQNALPMADDGELNYGLRGHASSRNVPTSAQRRMTAFRRFAVGDYVLISNHNLEEETYNLVNSYGFPELGGGATTSEQRRGPYIYLLAKVVSVHFGEDAQYYTVRREDNMEEQRADTQWMEPITNQVGIDAAKIAAQKRQASDDGIVHNNAGEGLRWLQPCVGVLSIFVQQLREGGKKLTKKMKSRTDACLNGNPPYGISIRFTGVNFLVICSIWYLYIDQLRLAFMPDSADKGCAIVSCIVWMVLFIELVIEVFIRPSGYRDLVRSDKAYLPSTVRYLNTFHLVSELISLIFFVPEFMCLFGSKSCGARYSFSLAKACIMSLYGPDRLHAFYGTAYLCMLRLRIFGLVRHWTKMWINNTFVRVRGKDGEWRVHRGRGFFIPQRNWGGQSREGMVAMEKSMAHQLSALTQKGKADGEEEETDYTDDYHLTNASKIGTALFTTNAQRALLFVFLIGLSPLIRVLVKTEGGINQHLQTSVELLQSNNLALNATDNRTCDQLKYTILDWVASNAFETRLDGTKQLHILSLGVEPVRCSFQRINSTEDAGTLAAITCQNNVTTINHCSTLLPFPFLLDDDWDDGCYSLCRGWSRANEEKRLEYLNKPFGIRPSVTVPVVSSTPGENSPFSGEIVSSNFSVSVLYNEELSVRRTIIYLFTLQLSMTMFVLLGLSVLRYDAGRLVLGPLRRMLKIVAFYAKNPLSPPPEKEGGESNVTRSFQSQNGAYYDSDDEISDKQLGTYETKQLINAVTKITDLLRKCWGVAGADIISSNLARQAIFNPTVPGRAVYALFAFVTIDKFQSHLHSLKGDIMILINDIAAVLHEEVYRWGYEDRGQCNKNLGGAFLMVYRIGAVSEVLEKRERAEAVIFQGTSTAKARKRKSHRRQSLSSHKFFSSMGTSSTQTDADRYSRSRVDNLDLSSLPGMRTFTDRALLGLLKTFCGIHRDKTILAWNDDIRLGLGVGATSINLMFGMDAGWAVEGAVGSSYKIDATYLSPHVNMASRMMSATKQYAVFILLSQAVQRLLSENAKDKLRHIDTVTVKGSSVQQKIFTYDSKVRNDFFLYSKTESQADLDSERYSPAIWNMDQDLVAMRNHISDDFIETFNHGRDEYLAGNWPEAIRLLKSADKMMFEREVEEGYADRSYGFGFKSMANFEAEERLSMGDGPCQRLIAYMEEKNGKAPSDWSGYRPLTSK